MIDKNFDDWNKVKKHTEEKSGPFFYEREVWFTKIGENIGFEQCGKNLNFARPVLILKKFNNDIFWGIPLTKSDKDGNYYFKFILNEESSTAILSQLKLVDGKRLMSKIGKIDKDNFNILKQKIRKLLE